MPYRVRRSQEDYAELGDLLVDVFYIKVITLWGAMEPEDVRNEMKAFIRSPSNHTVCCMEELLVEMVFESVHAKEQQRMERLFLLFKNGVDSIWG